MHFLHHYGEARVSEKKEAPGGCLELGGYGELLASLKERIGPARMRAALAVNSEPIELYWHLGREILARQRAEGWGSKVIERLSRDLRSAFPEMKGLSYSSLRYMQRFAASWEAKQFASRLLTNSAGRGYCFHRLADLRQKP